MIRFFILALLVAISIPSMALAQNFFGPIVPQTCDGPTCQACHLVLLADNIIEFLISIFAVIGAILVAWAGLLMATSRGDTGQLARGKSILLNSIVGLVIMLVAWLVVDTIMKTLAGSDAYGMWQEIKCVEIKEYTNTATLVSPDANPLPEEEIGEPPVLVVNPDYAFSWQTGIRAQESHASGELNLLLSCMSSKVEPDVGQISSISDSYIVNGSKTWQQCAGGQCQHGKSSCHYGGKSCVGKSYAVDFGDEWNAGGLAAAAKACGADFIGNEGDHLHVSVGAACGCH